MKQGISTNIGTYVGSSQIWTYVHGEKAGPPTPEETRQDAGAGAHRHGAGRAGCGQFAERAAGIVDRYRYPGGHVRRWRRATAAATPPTCAPKDAACSNRWRRPSRSAGARDVPVDIIHLKIAEHAMWGQMPELTATIAAPGPAGQQVQANVYPYRAGQNNLATIIPPWAHEGGSQAMIAAPQGPGAAPAAGERDPPRHPRHELVRSLHRHRRLGGHAAGLALQSEVQAVRRQAHEPGDRRPWASRRSTCSSSCWRK